MKDKRTVKARRNDAAHEALVERRRSLRIEQLETARLLCTLDSCAHFVYSACANIREFGERNGFSGREALTLARVGLAIRQIPRLEQEILDGLVSLENAAVVGRALGHPDVKGTAEDWALAAKTMTNTALERHLRKKIEEARIDDDPILMAMYVSPKGKEDFNRAQIVASRKAKKTLSDGETLEKLTDFYLDAFDPDRVKPGKRRMPDTNDHPGRTVPAEVRRELRARSGDRCEFPDCGNRVFLDFAHDKPHAAGGSREADNGFLFCKPHHKLKDKGFFSVERTAGGPVFRDLDGNLIGKGHDPPAGSA